MIKTPETLEDAAKTIETLLEQVKDWKQLYFDRMGLGGKMYWDGATYGFARGSENNSAYNINKSTPSTAESISRILAAIPPKSTVDRLEDIKVLLPLTFFITRYNTGDLILFRYINGVKTVVKIITHDGYVVDKNGMFKDPKATIF